ncbi:MAG: class II aldolase/adducin family protein [bacterium]
MRNVSAQTVHKFVEASHEVAARGFVRCSSGNMSVRIDSDRMLIKASRSWMGSLTTTDVCVCRISDCSLLSGRKASVEVGFHAGIMRTRPEVNVVLHFQTPFATAMACRRPGKVNFFVIPEIPFYIGEIARIPYLDPGSRELAKAVTDAIRTHDMVLMGNHGQTTVAADFSHVVQNAEFFELACEILIRGGNSVRPISAKQAKHLLSLKRRSSPASV